MLLYRSHLSLLFLYSAISALRSRTRFSAVPHIIPASQVLSKNATAGFDQGFPESLQMVQGREHRDTIRCMNGLAELRIAQRSFDNAKSILAEALEISSRTRGDDHTWTLTSMNGLTIVYKVQGQFDEAELLLLEAVDGRVLNLGDIHPHTLQSLNNLIALDKAWKKPKSGKQNCRK